MEDVIPAAGGKLLLLHLPKLRQLAVFDVMQSKVMRYLPLPSDDVLFAAGAEKLLVIARDQNVIQRWNLKTLQKDLTTALPDGGRLSQAVIGYASMGPVMLTSSTGPQFLDVDSLKLLDVKTAFSGVGWATDRLEVHASADGETFAARQQGISPAGLRILTLEGKTARAIYEHVDAGKLLPSPDGMWLFTSRGVYSSDLKAVAPDQFGKLICIPSYHPSYFLTFSFPEPFTVQANPRISIYTTGDRRLLFTLPHFPELAQTERSPLDHPGLGLDRIVHYFPDENLIVTLNEAHDGLILPRFNIIDAMEQAWGSTFSLSPLLRPALPPAGRCTSINLLSDQSAAG